LLPQAIYFGFRFAQIGVLRTIGDVFASIGRQKIFGSLRCTNHSEGIPIHHEVMTDRAEAAPIILKESRSARSAL